MSEQSTSATAAGAVHGPAPQLFSFDAEFIEEEQQEDDEATMPLAAAAAAASATSEPLTKTSLHSIGFKSASSNYTLCPICGDKISGNHYGVNTCESCKGFFKRTKKSTGELKCVNGTNSCPMSIDGRKLCAKCRYDKCLAVGMSEGVKARLVTLKPDPTVAAAAAAAGAVAPARTASKAGDEAGSLGDTLYLPSLASTRTRTIKRRIFELDDESPLAKRVNSAPEEPLMRKSASDHTIVTLDQQPPKETSEPAARGEECPHCFRSLENLNAYNKRTHLDHCKFRDKSNCIYCMLSLVELGPEQRKAHINECKVEHNNQIHKDAKDERPSSSAKKKEKARPKVAEPPKKVRTSPRKEETEKPEDNDQELTFEEEEDDDDEGRENETTDLDDSQAATERLDDSSAGDDQRDAAEGIESTLSAVQRAPSSRLKARRQANSANASPEREPAATPRSSKQSTHKNNNSSPQGSSASAAAFVKCKGYKPDIALAADSIYSNFPFQALDFDRENIKFVMENGVFHNHNCAKRDYRLMSDSRDQCNRFCSDLMYNKYLQNIVKRSQIKDNFSSVPHIYLTFNQLKKELNHYRESIKKLKLDNLNLKRTIDSLRSKEENYKRFVHLLAQKDYTKLNQIITVCLNQKKGINGIIDKLLDTMEGVYHPREKEVNFCHTEDVDCKICSEKVSLFKMRDHVAAHLRAADVPEDATRCGFCGLAQSCSIAIKVTKCKGNNVQAFWPVSDCPYFKNFNLKMSNKPTKGLLASNRPIECHICKKAIWSFNVKAHFAAEHSDAEPPELLTDDESAAARNEDVSCKICNELVGLAKMRDHVTKHVLFKEVSENESTCGFCGLVGCSIEIRVTSGKGKNTTYGPHSNCPYFRKFNLKSSTRPTKSSPSTNRPIECHICKRVFWSYNVKCHFMREHPEESAPELITDMEREMIARS